MYRKSARSFVLLGHGSRSQRTSTEFESLHAKLCLALNQEPVFIGYIELAKPSLVEALTSAAKIASEVIVLPMQLGSASHVKNDIPLAIAAVQNVFPGVTFTSLGAMGDHPRLQELCARRLKPHFVDVDVAETSLLFLGRGSGGFRCQRPVLSNDAIDS